MAISLASYFSSIKKNKKTLRFIFVPETKGRSLEEIQQFFRSNTDVDESPIIDNQVTLEEETRPDVDQIVP